MKLHELAPVAGSTTEAKRKGRGIGTGNGKTAGRGGVCAPVPSLQAPHTLFQRMAIL